MSTVKEAYIIRWSFGSHRELRTWIKSSRASSPDSSVSVPGIRLFEVQHEEGQEGKEMKVIVPEDTDKLPG